MAIDPVCGKEVEEGRNYADYRGKRYFFCSVECRHRFEAAPEEFEGKGTQLQKPA